MADEEKKTQSEAKASVERPTLDEGKGSGGAMFKLLVVLLALCGAGYYAYTKGYHIAALEKFGYTLGENGIEKLADTETEPAADDSAPDIDIEETQECEESAGEDAVEEPKVEPTEEETPAASRREGPFTGYEWVNVTSENRIGGRMVSPGYLRGKTVLIDTRDYGSKSCVEDAKALQQIWSTYKTKEFVVIGCHTGTAEPARVAKIMDKLGLTYPIYKGAGVIGRDGENVSLPAFAVLDSTGMRFMHKGADIRRVSGVVGNLIFATKRPSGANMWKTLLDWEIENMPGHAFNRLRDLMSDDASRAEVAKKYPSDMKRYVETYEKWKGSNEIKKIAKLVGLAVAVKDRDVNSEEAKKITKAVLKKTIDKYSALKESTDARIVQEAKNAIADLQFVSASLKR